MKKVLIIGAKGMLGGELVRVFDADPKFEVISVGCGRIDISDEAQVAQKINELKPDVIVNAAAYNAVDKAEESGEFELAKKINGFGPGHLARAAKEAGAIFVHYSTDYVFDGQKEAGYKEDDQPSPISNYGFSKLLGEQEVQKEGGRFFIIRLQKLFGRPGDSPAAKKSFFETMLGLAEQKEELDLVDEELANFTFAPDLAKQTKFLVESKNPAGIYHIINEGRPVTWYGAARILFELADKKIKLNPVGADKFPRPAKRPRFSILLNTKLPPLRPWDEALKEFLKAT